MENLKKETGQKYRMVLMPITAGPGFLVPFLIMFLALSVVGQDLPDKIRGYKVKKAGIVVKTEDMRPQNPQDESKNEAFVTVGEPRLTKVSATGITIQLNAAINSIEASGTVDFLTFYDFRVNDLNIDVEEYKESFNFDRKKSFALPRPIEINVSTPNTLRGAINELKDSKDKWRITGRIFVFGRFRKAGFKFKRVVPVDIDILIDNPIKAAAIT